MIVVSVVMYVHCNLETVCQTSTSEKTCSGGKCLQRVYQVKYSIHAKQDAKLGDELHTRLAANTSSLPIDMSVLRLL